MPQEGQSGIALEYSEEEDVWIARVNINDGLKGGPIVGIRKAKTLPELLQSLAKTISENATRRKEVT